METKKPTRGLRLKEVCNRTGISCATVYELIARGQFPAPRKMGVTSIWLESELDSYLESLPTAQGGPK